MSKKKKNNAPENRTAQYKEIEKKNQQRRENVYSEWFKNQLKPVENES